MFHTRLCEIDKNDSVASTGGFSAINNKEQLGSKAGGLAPMASRAENLSHRCKSVPTGTLSAKIFQGLKTRSTYIGFQNEGGKEQTNGLATWLLEVKPDNWW